MANNDRGLDRGGAGGQEGELDNGTVERGVVTGQGGPGAGGVKQQGGGDLRNLNERDAQKQRGGIGKEPNLEKGQPPKHQVD